MNVSNLILQLKNEVNSCTADQQMISKAIKLLELGAVFNATSFSALPPASANAGRIYFVNFDGLYFSNGFYWIRIVDTTVSAIWGWGDGGNFKLGNNSAEQSITSPVSVIGGVTNWSQVSAGYSHTLALRSDGTAWAWGSNTSGRLGNNGNFTPCSSPASVAGGFTDWCQVSAGRGHSLGVRTNGTAWAWGGNSCAQLGDCTTVDKSSPVSVVGGFTDWCQVAAGSYHSLGLRSGGTLWSWGGCAAGALGDNCCLNRSSPVSVVGGFTDWCQISAGRFSSAAVRCNGTLWAWGQGTYGRLGQNCDANRSSPVSFLGGFTNWCQVAVGYGHIVGIRSNGTIWAAGRNHCGQLGDNSITNRSSPVSVVGGFTDWCRIGTASSATFGIRTNGSLWSWGSSANGQLGDGTLLPKSSPVSVIGGITGWCQVSTNGNGAGASVLALTRITL